MKSSVLGAASIMCTCAAVHGFVAPTSQHGMGTVQQTLGLPSGRGRGGARPGTAVMALKGLARKVQTVQSHYTNTQF